MGRVRRGTNNRNAPGPDSESSSTITRLVVAVSQTTTRGLRRVRVSRNNQVWRNHPQPSPSSTSKESTPGAALTMAKIIWSIQEITARFMIRRSIMGTTRIIRRARRASPSNTPSWILPSSIAAIFSLRTSTDRCSRGRYRRSSCRGRRVGTMLGVPTTAAYTSAAARASESPSRIQPMRGFISLRASSRGSWKSTMRPRESSYWTKRIS